jgi:hypothetical protein
MMTTIKSKKKLEESWPTTPPIVPAETKDEEAVDSLPIKETIEFILDYNYRPDDDDTVKESLVYSEDWLKQGSRS